VFYVDMPEQADTAQSVSVTVFNSSMQGYPAGPSYKQIWPYWADVSTCKDENGTARSSKGRDSSDLFALEGCAKEKSYYVRPGVNVTFSILTDSSPLGLCIYPDFTIFEFSNGSWSNVRRFNFTSSPGLVFQQDYEPNSTMMKLYADRCFHLRVFQVS
jgi:hypothetical protein